MTTTLPDALTLHPDEQLRLQELIQSRHRSHNHLAPPSPPPEESPSSRSPSRSHRSSPTPGNRSPEPPASSGNSRTISPPGSPPYVATMLKKGGEAMGQHQPAHQPSPQPQIQYQQHHGKLGVDASMASAGGAGRWREWMRGMIRVPPSAGGGGGGGGGGGERRD